MNALWNWAGDGLIAALGLIPLGGVKVLIVLYFAALVSLGFMLPRSYIFEGTPDQKFWRDIRFWAVVVIALEMIPYLYF